MKLLNSLLAEKGVLIYLVPEQNEGKQMIVHTSSKAKLMQLFFEPEQREGCKLFYCRAQRDLQDQHFHEVQLFRALGDFVYKQPFSQMDNEMIFTLILSYFSGFEGNTFHSAAFVGHFLFLSIYNIISYHLWLLNEVEHIKLFPKIHKEQIQKSTLTIFDC